MVGWKTSGKKENERKAQEKVVWLKKKKEERKPVRHNSFLPKPINFFQPNNQTENGGGVGGERDSY